MNTRPNKSLVPIAGAALSPMDSLTLSRPARSAPAPAAVP